MFAACLLLALGAQGLVAPRNSASQGSVAHGPAPLWFLAMADGRVSTEVSSSPEWVEAQSRALLLRMGDSLESKREKSAAYDSLLLSPSAPALLDAALELLDETASSPLAKSRLPVRLPSRRAALGCYSRALDYVVSEGCDVSGGYEVYGDCRRTQLLDIFRELKDQDGPSGIYALEGRLVGRDL